MRQRDGIASVLEEERFEQKLRKLSMLSAKEKRRKWSAINAQEKLFVSNHRDMNESIDNRRQFELEWRQENPDGEYPEN